MQRVVIYGGRGSLGSTLVKLFAKRSWGTISVDFIENTNALHNIVIPQKASFLEQSAFVSQELTDILGSEKVDAVLCVAGGWTGGNLKSKDFIQNVNHMIQVSVHTSVISAQLAAMYLKEGGLLLLPGAAGALSPTPDAIGYGLAKAGVHHLVKSLSKAESGLPKNSVVCGIAPTILDTEANRHAMPNADTSKWIKLDALGQQIVEWSCGDKKPKNGALYKIESENGEMKCEEVKNL